MYAANPSPREGPFRLYLASIVLVPINDGDREGHMLPQR